MHPEDSSESHHQSPGAASADRSHEAHAKSEPAGASPSGPEKGSDRRPTASWRHLGTLAVCAAVAYAADQAVKAWVVNTLRPDEPRNFLGSVLKLRRISNPGAAFSFATNATWLLTVIAAAVVIWVLVTARRLRSLGWAVAFGLLVGGALGNLTDRFVRAPGGGRGEVVDFLELPHWPIFNIADCCICTAAALIVVLTMRGVGLDGVVQRDDPKKQADSDQEDRT